MKVFIKRLRDNAKLPTRGSDYAVGWDVYAAIEDKMFIFPHTTMKVGIGFAMQPEDDNYYLTVNARSGLASSEGLRPANCVGICDWDYTGEYIVAVHNDSDECKFIEPNQKIAQLVLQRKYDIEFEEVDELKTTDRADGGFGHTAKY